MWQDIKYFLALFISSFLISLGFIASFSRHIYNVQIIFLLIFTGMAIILIVHGIFNTYLLLYAWDDPDQAELNKSPRKFSYPVYSFTAIIPARHEVNVIEQTIKAMVNIDYPEHLKEILIVCRSDDKRTIAKIQKTISEINQENIRLVIFDNSPINKPHALNIGLAQANKNLVVVFDAEDEPHSDIFNVANTVFLREHIDVLQSGVQLMNYQSRWFSVLNVLEYFFWFKSSLQFFSRQNLIPLGGNTVFFKKNILEAIGGWDETCLTEDADIGIRLSALGARIRVVYDETHTTHEETPPTVKNFIKQRTRWDQGFLQVLFKGDWLQLPSFRQKLLAFYVLAMPEIELLLTLFLPLSIVTLIKVKVPVVVALLSIIPMLILFLQVIIYIIGIYEFTHDYKIRFSFFSPIQLIVGFYPYQLLLSFSSLRSILRQLGKNISWEKTTHTNAHRITDDFFIPYVPLAFD